MTLDPSVAAVRLAVRRGLRTQGDGKGLQAAAETHAVVVACSGGADSLALLAATVFELRRAPVRVIGAVVDHGLQDDRATHTARVVEQMASLGVDETVSARVQVEASGRGLEAGARRARYAVLGQIAESFDARRVLLGHTLDDQAETVILGLARGSGGRSIAGMRPHFLEGATQYLRPLLGVRRSETEAACRAESIAFWVDPHNSDPRFTRSRVRHSVLPLLEAELGPGVAETLARTALQLRPDMEALDEIAERHLEWARQGGDEVRLDALRSEPDAIVSRVLRQAALDAGAIGSELFAVHVNALHDLVAGRLRGEVHLPGHLTAYLDQGRIRFRATDPLR